MRGVVTNNQLANAAGQLSHGLKDIVQEMVCQQQAEHQQGKAHGQGAPENILPTGFQNVGVHPDLHQSDPKRSGIEVPAAGKPVTRSTRTDLQWFLQNLGVIDVEDSVCCMFRFDTSADKTELFANDVGHANPVCFAAFQGLPEDLLQSR